MPEGQKSQVNESGYKSAQDQKPEHKLKKPARRITNIVRLAVLVVVVAIIVLIYLHFKNSQPVPKNIKKSADLTIYYPKDIPVDKKTFQLSNNNKLLTYLVHYNGSSIYITEQPKPQYFDFADFVKGIKSPVTIQTPVGSATIGALGGRVVGDLPAIDSWILVSAKTGTSPDNIAEVLKRMQKA